MVKPKLSFDTSSITIKANAELSSFCFSLYMSIYIYGRFTFKIPGQALLLRFNVCFFA